MMPPPTDPASANGTAAPSYGTVPGTTGTPARPSLPATRPGLPPRAPSLQSARNLAGASGLAPTTTLRQSGSLRALFRMTSTLAGNASASADTVVPVPAPRPAKVPLQQTRSLRGPRRAAKETVPLLRRSLTTSQLPPLARAMSSVLRLPRQEEDTFRCHICFDDVVPVSEAVTLSACSHRYCTACFKSYLEIKIKEGNVYPVCFHPIDDPARKTCGVAVATKQIETLVAAEVWKKLNLFRFNKEHEHARECPHCGFSQECQGSENPECECAQCGKPFCFFHDIAHEGRSCADYELENAEAESINRATINQIAKPCPGCQRDVEKDGGCNHMKCVVCQTSFCWLCSEIIEDVPMPSHFSDSSENPCSGKQFDGTTPLELPWQVGLYALFVAILCYPFAFLIAVVFTPITWCRSGRENESTFGEMFWFNHTLAMIWLALVISLVFFIIAIVVELTFRLIVFTVTLPFIILRAIGSKIVSCCRRSTQRQQSIVEEEETVVPEPNAEDDVDLEAGHAHGEASPTAKEEGERVAATPHAVMV